MGKGTIIMSEEPEELIVDSHQDVILLPGFHLDPCWCQVCHRWEVPELCMNGLRCIHCGNRI